VRTGAAASEAAPHWSAAALDGYASGCPFGSPALFQSLPDRPVGRRIVLAGDVFGGYIVNFHEGAPGAGCKRLVTAVRNRQARTRR
jgi:hypothetical protein